MPTVIQTVAGAGQFTGLAGAGLFTFATLDRIPRTTRVVLSEVAIHAAIGAPPLTRVDFYLVRPAGPATARILLGRGLAPAIVGPDGDADYRVCGVPLPRDPGNNGPHWELVVTTVGKTVTATVSVDWVLVPYVDSNQADPLVP